MDNDVARISALLRVRNHIDVYPRPNNPTITVTDEQKALLRMLAG